jgi:hypothetical protein
MKPIKTTKTTKRERFLLIVLLLAIILYVVCAITGEVHFRVWPAVAGGFGGLAMVAYIFAMQKVRKFVKRIFPPKSQDTRKDKAVG